jgi:transcriptional regulator with XRE-family HTH domain
MPTFGQELRQQRQNAGLSLTQLAQQVHYSKGYLSKIESDVKPPNVTFARLCDMALGTGGSLVALAAGARTEQADEQASDLPADYLLHEREDGWLHAVPSSATAVLSNPDAAVALFQARLHQTRSLGDLLNAALVLPMLIGETHVLRGLASTAVEAPIAQQLWFLAAQYGELAGRMFQEIGDDRQALWWTTYAARLAARGGSSDLEYSMLLHQAEMALDRDDPFEALSFTKKIQDAPSLSARTYALAAQRAAQAQALLGDFDSCMRELDRASALLDAQTNSGVADEGVASHSIDLARGWALFDLGRSVDAAAVLGDVFDQMPSERVRERTRVGVRLALTLAVTDDIDRACQLISELLPAIQQLDSATIRHDLRLLQRELRRRNSRREVQDLLPAMTEAIRSRRQP